MVTALDKQTDLGKRGRSRN